MFLSHGFHLSRNQKSQLMFVVYPSQVNTDLDVQDLSALLAFSADVEVVMPEMMPGELPKNGIQGCLHLS